MRGRLLGVDRDTGEGQVAGDDGRRYRFRRDDWAGQAGPGIGQVVDFRTNDDRAVSVFPLPGSASPVAPRVPRRRAGGRAPGRDKLVAAALALLVGAFGVHRFYLGRVGSGLAMLVLSITLIGLVASISWALVDAARLLWMTNREFADRYPG